MVDLKAQSDINAAIKQAASVLDAGGLVVFPTETVYGIGCIVRPDAIARLDLVKGRAAEKRYTLHIADKTKVSQYVPHLSLRARKLIQGAWPGPLTLVFDLHGQDLSRIESRLGKDVFDLLYRDCSIGIRCPDHTVATALLAHVDRPVVAPSANPGGMPPATDVHTVIGYLDGKVQMVLDAGPCRYGMSSTVAKVTASYIEILRQGVLKKEQLEAISQVRLLFVCTGNTCRSPMAEGLCRRYLAERLGCRIDQLQRLGYSIQSAGITEISGIPASSGARAACAARGVDIGGHKSRPLTAELIQQSDLILAMDQMHIDEVLTLAPEVRDRCMLLDEMRPIQDPVGQSAEVFEQCADQIWVAIDKRIRELVL